MLRAPWDKSLTAVHAAAPSLDLQGHAEMRSEQEMSRGSTQQRLAVCLSLLRRPVLVGGAGQAGYTLEREKYTALSRLSAASP